MRMMARSTLKLWVCMACLASSASAPAQPTLQMDLIDLAAISRMSPQQLEALAEGLAAQEMMRTKRSSAQALASASKSSAGLTSKIGFLGQASAGAVSLISSASSASSKSGHDEHHGYSYEPHEPKVDYWGLKKSILYTLFQAVKAITGGVTILKGQLIRGGGALASTFGKVISVKGEAVSNFGKKIVSSAALSTKPHHHSPPVYGPPAHIDYPPSAYSAPTAPAHYQHTAPSAPAPTGFAAHKYPSQLDGRGKYNGVQAGLVLLAPLGDDSSNAIHHAPSGPAHSGHSHTPLDPPSSILHSAYSAIKDALSHVVPSHAAPPPTSYASEHHEHHEHQDIHDHPPPPPQPVPPFKPMQWPAFNSYGEPAAPDSYSADYNPVQHYNTLPSYDHYASAKHSKPHYKPPGVSHGLTPEKLHKLQRNLDKLARLNLQLQRSSEEEPQFNAIEAYKLLFEKGAMTPQLPTAVVSDAEIGVLPAALLPTELPPLPPSPNPPTSPSSTVETTTTTTTAPPTDEKTRRRKETKYLLRGNKIIIV